jgi:RecA-family ATPase
VSARPFRELNALLDADPDLAAGLAETDDAGTSPASLPVRIADAFDEPVPDIAWIAEGFLPTGALVLLAAYGGIGKTTLLVQLCASLAAGRDFLDFHVPQAIPTLYLIAEGARHVFIDRVRVALARLGLDATGLPLWISPRELMPEIGPTLDIYIEKTGARLIVLDTIGLFHDGDENSASDFKAKVVKPLREIMGRRDVSFVLVTHEVKPNAERKGRHRVRGTSALVDDSDVAIRLEAPEGDRATPRLLVFEKVRTGASIEPIPLEFVPAFALFERVGEDAMRERQQERTAETDVRRLKDLEAQVVRYLKRDPDGLTKAELTAELHPRRVDLVRVLDKLRDESRAFPDRDPKGRAMRWRLSAAPRLEVAG